MDRLQIFLNSAPGKRIEGDGHKVQKLLLAFFTNLNVFWESQKCNKKIQQGFEYLCRVLNTRWVYGTADIPILSPSVVLRLGQYLCMYQKFNFANLQLEENYLATWISKSNFSYHCKTNSLKRNYCTFLLRPVAKTVGNEGPVFAVRFLSIST